MTSSYFVQNIDTLFRNAPWGGAHGTGDIVVVGLNWAAGTFLWTFKDDPGGTALITLENAVAGLEGVSASYDAGYLDPETGAVVGATIIRPQIDEATINGIPAALAPSSPVLLHHALHVTPPGLPEIVYCIGLAPIKPE